MAAGEFSKDGVRVGGVIQSRGLNHPAPIPSGVFLGSRFEASKNGEVLDICEQKKIALYRMRLADDRFELLPEQFVG
jgi:hypothetical protein